jgi:hypothetical protein
MSMTIDYITELRRVGCVTTENFTDIVKYIEWEVHFFETSLPDHHSVALIKTELDVDDVNAESFVAFSDVTKANIVAWGLAKQGGTDFLDILLEAGHARNVEDMLRVLQYTQKDIDLIPAD